MTGGRKRVFAMETRTTRHFVALGIAAMLGLLVLLSSCKPPSKPADSPKRNATERPGTAGPATATARNTPAPQADAETPRAQAAAAAPVPEKPTAEQPRSPAPAPAPDEMGGGNEPEGLQPRSPGMTRPETMDELSDLQGNTDQEFTTETPPEKPAETDRMWLWEDFERAGRWAVDSADDPAEISLGDTEHTQGDRSLQVDFSFVRKGKVLVAKETRLNLEGLSKIVVDVYAPAAAMDFSVAFKTSAGNIWYESKTFTLKKGWNRNITVRLSEDDFRAITAQKITPAFIQRLDDVRQVFLILQKGKADVIQDTVYLDNVRFWGTPVADWNLTEPKIVAVYQPTTKVNQYAKFEVGVRIDGAFSNMFDSRDIAVDAVFAGPGNTQIKIPGFFAGYAADEKEPNDRGPIWLIRFAPAQSGRWEFNILATNKLGQSISETRWFYCDQAKSKGYIRRSRNDARYFAFENGDFYFPIGQNIAWASDFEFYFKRQAATGQNWVRIWLCPWSLWLENKQAGVFDLAVANQIDKLIDLATKYDLRIQLCLEYHGMLNQSSWGKNPYNAERGGPCATAADFFTNGEAQRLFKQRLRYVAARWGYSTRIFAWELCNEVDLTYYATENSVYTWHRSMSEYLKQVDAGRHLVTTSFYNDLLMQDVWKLGSIDFTQSHIYTKDIVRAVVSDVLKYRKFNKPFFIGEFAGGAEADADARDRRGITLHNGLWAMAVLPAAGLAAPWWWDKQIQPNKLERRFQPVAAFRKGVDLRGKQFAVIDQNVILGGDHRVNILGMISNSEAYFWLYDADWNADSMEADRRQLIPANSKLALTNILSGRYELTFFDTDTGKVLHREELTTTASTAVLSLPESKEDIAIKLVFLGDSRPRLMPQIEVGRRLDGATY